MTKFILKSGFATIGELHKTRDQAEKELEQIALSIAKEFGADEYDSVKGMYTVTEVETNFFVFEFYYDENNQLVQNKVAEFDTEEEAKAYSEPLDNPIRRVFYVEGAKSD